MIKLAKRKYLKPLICADCGKLVLIVKHELGTRCQRCSRRRSKKLKKMNMKVKRKAMGLSANRYDAKYRRIKSELLEKHPWCSLCGSTEDLTCHHVGGCETNDKLTVLCGRCHQAYEAWNERKMLEEKWKMENLAGGNSSKNTRKASTRLLHWLTS